MKFVLFGMVGIVAASLWIWIIYLRHYKGWAKWLHWLPLILLVLCVALGGSSMLGWYLMTALITAFFIPQGVLFYRTHGFPLLETVFQMWSDIRHRGIFCGDLHGVIWSCFRLAPCDSQ